MKIETKLRRFVKNILNDKILDGFSIIVDAKTDIWYLVGFDIHKNLFIVSKAETGSTFWKELNNYFLVMIMMI